MSLLFLLFPFLFPFELRCEFWILVGSDHGSGRGRGRRRTDGVFQVRKSQAHHRPITLRKWHMQ